MEGWHPRRAGIGLHTPSLAWRGHRTAMKPGAPACPLPRGTGGQLALIRI